MSTIPNDPMMLLSYINTKLRDDYSSLQLLCDDLELNVEDITSKLASIDYSYNEELNRFA